MGPGRNIVVVGAGFAGAVHARELALSGFDVHVMDKREHIAGNCFDFVDHNGIRRHRYGPHLFHTSMTHVVDWLSQFTCWSPYEHRVVARLEPSGGLVPLPVNVETLNRTFGVKLHDGAEIEAFLAGQIVRVPHIRNAEDYLYSSVGPTITNLFFRPYTRKMWGMDLNEISEQIVRRVQVRVSDDDRYFPNDSFQAMPTAGYTALFERLLDHPRIRVSLSTEFKPSDRDAYDFCFNSMPIDEFYGFKLGELPYRSIRFHHQDRPRAEAPSQATVNYTDAKPYTRETWWHRLPNHDVAGAEIVTATVEEPCDYRDNNHERYYPVMSADGANEAIYQRYAALAAEDKTMQFIGRCGTYRYLDMHQVINQSLVNVRRFIATHG